ncbi:putative pentatricopeptide repeat-containing protein At2g02150 isoform X1 [Malus sylvestris]|uniref:putative pentatricopeptide repeat-containing protein At2g02150 isoform X1 n=1 Tax=Malus sylvestris TaxID=3752 RepID=UPI0021AC8E8B|nr:putative pentatricopeptide repeat-containing protein At2g02150 isoform X1 [Malus sylvestris]XP_050115903.1 putative pentatricopeptide repeat-containing protein At2g02150 isoform X1 [Malus sylvestris]XP_050115904.1 putative pentatricopeptide repeat-containing protein At2g02150 isoform X1 [Malus sylvestris]XP_050115905.1 putative pentatricopeptide repeat-containing protein At2g02150 isoform X1 [Malus sylvestris]
MCFSNPDSWDKALCYLLLEERWQGCNGYPPKFKSCLVDSGFLRNSLFFVEKGNFRAYYATASALLTRYAHVFEENPLPVEAYVIQEIKAVRERSGIWRNRKLYPDVARVLKSLDWEVAWDLRFSWSVKQYGFSHSLSVFSVIVHVFALAGMKMEVQSFLNDIVCYYRDAKYDAFGLFPYVFDSSHNGARTLVFDALITAFAAYSMLENAVDVSVQTKNMQLEPHIWSCNFLLKCLAEANILESVRILFECLKKYGPSPNVYTYTIMMNFYCQGHEGKGVDIGEATNILQEMEKRGKHPTVVVYAKYIHALCKVGWVEFALDFIRNLRCRNQPLNSYCYNAILLGFCQKGETYEAWKILEEMKTYGMIPDVYCYTILIGLSWKALHSLHISWEG